MKINAFGLIFDYVRTIRGERWTILSTIDAIVIFILPFLVSISAHFFKDNIVSGMYLSLFTLFGVFMAVFMAVQGVLVPLYHTPRKASPDAMVNKRLRDEFHDRRKLVREVSTTLSYLKLFSLLSMVVLMIPISTGTTLFLFKWLAIALATHLLLNILVVLKRLHALFSYEFEITD